LWPAETAKLQNWYSDKRKYILDEAAIRLKQQEEIRQTVDAEDADTAKLLQQ
jgi:propanediol utilization protein|tara:strand:- start:3 stop:158 length:156 start_codon:yes stop_codon:yes gene_type:complete